MVTLVLWSCVVIYAYFINSATEYFALGVIVGIVLGGSQALSRSLYGSMVPEEASAEFYGFYSVFSKFSAIWGPMVFAIIRQVTGSSRLSIISLIIFFFTGLVLLFFVDEKKARAAKGRLTCRSLCVMPFRSWRKAGYRYIIRLHRVGSGTCQTPFTHGAWRYPKNTCRARHTTMACS